MAAMLDQQHLVPCDIQRTSIIIMIVKSRILLCIYMYMYMYTVIGGSMSEPHPCGLYRILYISCTFTVQHANVNPAHLKFKGQSVFVPVQFGSYSAMKPHSLGIVLRTSGDSYQTGD